MPQHETTGGVSGPKPQVPQTPEQTDEPPILQWSVVEDLRSQMAQDILQLEDAYLESIRHTLDAARWQDDFNHNSQRATTLRQRMGNRTLMAEIYGATELFSENLQAIQHDRIRYLAESHPHSVGRMGWAQKRGNGSANWAQRHSENLKNAHNALQGRLEETISVLTQALRDENLVFPPETVLSGLSFPQVADQMIKTLSVPPTTPLDCGATLFWTQATLGRLQTYPPQISVENFHASVEMVPSATAQKAPSPDLPTEPTPQDAPQKADSTPVITIIEHMDPWGDIQVTLQRIKQATLGVEYARLEHSDATEDTDFWNTDRQLNQRWTEEFANLAHFLNSRTTLYEITELYNRDLLERQNAMIPRLEEEGSAFAMRTEWARVRGDRAKTKAQEHENDFVKSRDALQRDLQYLRDLLQQIVGEQKQNSPGLFYGVNRASFPDALHKVLRSLKHLPTTPEDRGWATTWVQVALDSLDRYSPERDLAEMTPNNLVHAQHEMAPTYEHFAFPSTESMAKLETKSEQALPAPTLNWESARKHLAQAREHIAQQDATQATESLQKIVSLLEDIDLEVPELSDADLQHPLETSLDKVQENIDRASGWDGTVSYDNGEINATEAHELHLLSNQDAEDQPLLQATHQVARTYAEEREQWEATRQTHEKYLADHRGLTVAWSWRVIAQLQETTPADEQSA